MSLINQMLRDLDRQHGAANNAQPDALHRLGLIPTGAAGQWPPRAARIVATAAVAAAALVWWMAWGTGNHQSPRATVMPVRQPLTLPSPQPLALEARIYRAPEAPRKAADTTAALAAKAARQSIAAIEPVAVVAPPLPVAPDPNPAAKLQTLTPRETAERLFSQAQAALANGDDSRAASLLERALSGDATHSAARKQLAMLMIREGRPVPAESLLADGLHLSPRDSELAKAYAQLLVERGELSAALNALERFVAGIDEDADSLALRAGILDRLDRYGESVTAYRRALHLQPGRAIWWTGLGLALEHDGQSAAALAAYRRAARLPTGESVRNFVLQRVRALESPANRG